MKQFSRGFLTLTALIASAQALCAQPAIEAKTNETRIFDTSYLPASLAKIVDANHDSSVDAGVVVTRFEVEGKFVFEVVASQIVVLKHSQQASGTGEQESVSKRIYDTSYLPAALGKFADGNGDTYVDSGTSVTEVQTATASVFSAVKSPKYFDVRGAEFAQR
jgi:hypothetical protein